MPYIMNTKARRDEMVDKIEIRIGDEFVRHNFGRGVSMSDARALALHFVNVFTGEPSTFVANEPLP
jgi:hypothetical protein